MWAGHTAPFFCLSVGAAEGSNVAAAEGSCYEEYAKPEISYLTGIEANPEKQKGPQGAFLGTR